MHEGTTLLIQIWLDKGWTVAMEENPNRLADERWTCEVYEQVGKLPLPRGIGYVCGYGADEDAAVENAAYKLKYDKPEPDVSP